MQKQFKSKIMQKNFFYSVILVAGLVLAGSTGNLVVGGTQKTSVVQKTVKYTCPMHSEVIKDMPGKCPICDMMLVKLKEKHKVTKIYTCKMHPEVVMNKPGKCPKCAMALVEKMDKHQVRMKNMKDSILIKIHQPK